MTITFAYRWCEPPSQGLHDAFERAAATWEAVLDIDILEVESEADWTIYPSDRYGPGAADLNGPGCWINPALEQDYGGWAHDTYSGTVVPHELGHLLGLQHPHDYGSDVTMLGSIMSYSYVTNTIGATVYPDEPGLIDILMLGERFGNNTSTAASGTTHRVTSARGIDTVWDAGGTHDLLDMSSLVVGCSVDLGAGLVDLGGFGWAVLEGIEDVRLGGGADTVTVAGGELIFGLTKADRLIADEGEADKLSRFEKRELGVTGKWFELGGGYVEWKGGERGLEKLVMES